jgi:acyl-coenzyme A synthetase/AMP-(fatty) acid ligase
MVRRLAPRIFEAVRFCGAATALRAATAVVHDGLGQRADEESGEPMKRDAFRDWGSWRTAEPTFVAASDGRWATDVRGRPRGHLSHLPQRKPRSRNYDGASIPQVRTWRYSLSSRKVQAHEKAICCCSTACCRSCPGGWTANRKCSHNFSDRNNGWFHGDIACRG